MRCKKRDKTKFFNPVLAKKSFQLKVSLPVECESDLTLDKINLAICIAIQSLVGTSRFVESEIKDLLTGETDKTELGKDGL